MPAGRLNGSKVLCWWVLYWTVPPPIIYRGPWYLPEMMTSLFREKLLFFSFDHFRSLYRNSEWCIRFPVEKYMGLPKLDLSSRCDPRRLASSTFEKLACFCLGEKKRGKTSWIAGYIFANTNRTPVLLSHTSSSKLVLNVHLSSHSNISCLSKVIQGIAKFFGT
jgi:hypothetical protein